MKKHLNSLSQKCGQRHFTDHTTESPSDPQVGFKLDSEFDALNLTLNDIRSNLALLQRDDTTVANSSIHTEALSNAVLALIKATENGYGIKGAWVLYHLRVDTIHELW